MCVPGHQRKIKLTSDRGDPNVVVWDQLPNASEFRFDLALPFAGALIRQQEGGTLHKVADQRQLDFPALGA